MSYNQNKQLVTDLNNNNLSELVERARTGDREAFSEIVRMMMNPTLALTHKMTGDREAAADLAQDTFVSAWQNLKTFKGEAGFASWLYRIAYNKTLNYLRKVRPDALDENMPIVSEAIGPDRQLLQKELSERMLTFMKGLPTEQRAVFELRFYKELSFEEIAKVTSKALGTAKSLYREAVKKLRQTAEKEGWRP